MVCIARIPLTHTLGDADIGYPHHRHRSVRATRSRHAPRGRAACLGRFVLLSRLNRLDRLESLESLEGLERLGTSRKPRRQPAVPSTRPGDLSSRGSLWVAASPRSRQVGRWANGQSGGRTTLTMVQSRGRREVRESRHQRGADGRSPLEYRRRWLQQVASGRVAADQSELSVGPGSQ